MKYVFSIEIEADSEEAAKAVLSERIDDMTCQAWPELPEAPDEHPYTWAEEAADIIDANIFSGDAGYLPGLAYYKDKCERWLRGIQELATSFAEIEEDEEDES